MIDWKLIVSEKGGEEVIIDLTSNVEVSLKETDYIQFQATINDEIFNRLGAPYFVLGYVPIEMTAHYDPHNNRVFLSNEPLHHHSSRYFYNFFGESEIALAFENDNQFQIVFKANILARAKNALLANEMLTYISDNLEDAVLICFSRSKISGSYINDDTFNFTILDIIEESIHYISDNLPLFIRNHKHIWKPEILFSERGQPTGADSIHWVLTNLNRLVPSCIEESNLIYNNRSYRLDILPKESITPESDIFENKVIHTFLYHIIIFLNELKDTFNFEMTRNDNSQPNNEYVRFDHTMNKFLTLALKHRIKKVDSLLFSTEQLRGIFNKHIPSKITPGIQPKMTSYVCKNPHYRQTFKLIEQYNTAPAPDFEGETILLGLKNLSIVYEIASLLMLHNSIKRCFNVDHVEQSFRLHAENQAFGGKEQERPYGGINNLFKYKSDVFKIELFYEPKIYPMSYASEVGDLIDTSNTRRTTRYGKHHFCPDFVVKIQSEHWGKPITLIFDAKYKDSNTVQKYDIMTLTQKYLLNIHQINESRMVSVSSIQLFLILFAHDKSGNYVRTVSERHCLTGQLPVLPQSAGILLKPTDTLKLDEHLRALISLIDRERLIGHP